MTGVTARKPHKKHKGFTVSAEKVAPRNLAISAACGASELYQTTRELSNEDKTAAMLLHANELADTLFDNRHRFPKKPLVVSHMRTNIWYTELFGLTAPLQHAKANLVFDLFTEMNK